MFPCRLPVCAGLLALACLPLARPAAAQQDYLYGERQFSRYCKAPLKYAAGACVRRCPAGYRESGRGYCRPPDGTGFGR